MALPPQRGRGRALHAGGAALHGVAVFDPPVITGPVLQVGHGDALARAIGDQALQITPIVRDDGTLIRGAKPIDAAPGAPHVVGGELHIDPGVVQLVHQGRDGPVYGLNRLTVSVELHQGLQVVVAEEQELVRVEHQGLCGLPVEAPVQGPALDPGTNRHPSGLQSPDRDPVRE